MKMNPISVITDELDDDLETAFQLCLQLGVAAVELRTIDGSNWLALEREALATAVGRARELGLEVTALASSVFKCPLPGRPSRPGAALHGTAAGATLEEHWLLLDRALDHAASVGVPLIRMFSCWRVPDPREVFSEVVEIMAEAQERAAAFPVEVALENEHDCNVATARESLEILTSVPGLRLIWDPANHVRAGGAPPESSFDRSVDRIAHMHLKDVDAEGTWVVLGTGLVSCESVIDAAVRWGYRGAFSLETHCEIDGSRVKATEAGLDLVRDALGATR